MAKVIFLQDSYKGRERENRGDERGCVCKSVFGRLVGWGEQVREERVQNSAESCQSESDSESNGLYDSLG